jgi:protein-L-isoaspartate(D-aspartate) O-methyltransferase
VETIGRGPEADFDFDAERRRMIEQDLKPRGIRDGRVLAAMAAVPRHAFVPVSDWDEAYADHPLRIGCEQTISQPYIVAYMTGLLGAGPGMRLLEIGTGSGYQAAVLAATGAEVFTVERHAPLQARARSALREAGYADRIAFRVGDGTLGWEEEAPFDGILVTAAAPSVPEPLKAQLAPGGRLVLPVGRTNQRIETIVRAGDAFRTEPGIAVMFVPLIGEAGAPG